MSIENNYKNYAKKLLFFDDSFGFRVVESKDWHKDTFEQYQSNSKCSMFFKSFSYIKLKDNQQNDKYRRE